MGHGQLQILCIDDDVQGLRLRTLLLETAGYKVLPASDAVAGLRIFRGRDVAAVVMDYQMPGMNGGEAALEMKRLRPNIPVVILSSLPWLPEEAPREAIDAFIEKGAPVRLLVDSIEASIAKYQSARHVRGALGYFLGVLANAFRKKAVAQ